MVQEIFCKGKQAFIMTNSNKMADVEMINKVVDSAFSISNVHSAAILVYFSDVGTLIHLKAFDKEVESCIEAFSKVRKELDDPQTVFSGSTFIVEQTGKHPRQFFKEMLDQSML